jgi:D-alanyl-D-alanine dipeptidase
MSNAEKMIREDIANMTKYRLAPVRDDILRDIKYAYWHNFITEYIYKELMKLTNDRYNEIGSLETEKF